MGKCRERKQLGERKYPFGLFKKKNRKKLWEAEESEGNPCIVAGLEEVDGGEEILERS